MLYLYHILSDITDMEPCMTTIMYATIDTLEECKAIGTYEVNRTKCWLVLCHIRTDVEIKYSAMIDSIKLNPELF